MVILQTSLPGKDAELYTRLPNGRIKCTACARLCEIPEGKVGLCGIRGVENAAYYGAHGIAYTYNEPSIFIEFAKDCGIEAHKRGIFNIFVSNGYDTPESVNMMSQFLDSIALDFKVGVKHEVVGRSIAMRTAPWIPQTV